jgi:multidrug resistance efflux pump
MSERIRNLAECSEFRQTLEARPPRIVHGAALLLIALLGSAAAWAAVTQADLVVRAAGRIRPVSVPKKVFNAGRGEVFSGSVGGRVVEVNFKQGQEVRQGDVLIRLDAERLDNDIAKGRRAVQALDEELAKGEVLARLTARQFEAAKAKAEAEWEQAQEEINQAKVRQVSDIRLAQSEMETAADEEGRLRQLVRQRAGTPADLVKAVARVTETQEKLRRAELPVDESRLKVLRRAMEVAEKDNVLRQEELAAKQRLKKGERETARSELANLELERKQAVLLAPVSGVITTGDVKVGDVLEPGKAVAEIAEQRGYVFEAAVPSDEVGHLQLGMTVNIKLDAYDYQKYGSLRGTVLFISPDSGVPEGQRAAFYVVKVAVEEDAVGRGDLRGPVKLGMTGQAEIVTGQESLLLILGKKIRRTISLG